MNTSPYHVLLRVGVELYYRCNRIEHYLNEIKVTDSIEYKQLANTVIRFIHQIDKLLPSTIKTLLPMKKLPEEERFLLLFDDLKRLSYWFLNIHIELLKYLPSKAVLPETIDMLVTGLGNLYLHFKPSILLGNDFNAYEFDFYENLTRLFPSFKQNNLTNEKNIVLQLPLCDRYSPTYWAVLAHEIGHAIDNEHKISKQATEKISDSQSIHKLSLPWIQELCADLIAAEVFGPVSILSLLSIEYCLYPFFKPKDFIPENIHEKPESHPATKWRLNVVSDHLKNKYNNDFLTNEFELYQAAWVYSLGRNYSDPVERNEKIDVDDAYYEYFIKPIIPELTTIISTCLSKYEIPSNSIIPDSLHRCISRLSKGLSIAAQGKDRASLRDAISSYRTQQASSQNERVDKFQSLKKEFKEKPLEIPTLLLSGSERRLQLIEAAIQDESYLTEIERFEELCGNLAKVDELLISSIGTSMIHRKLINKDNDIEF